jgi:hypothetical protein
MKRLALLGVVLWLAGAARAGPLFQDPYGVGAPDVLGAPELFDVRSLEIDVLAVGDLRITLRMSYAGGDATLAPFTGSVGSLAGISLGAGDVLFAGREHLWAIPLAGPSGAPGGGYLVAAAVATAEATPRQVFPGGLYRVPGFLSAAEVLGLAPGDDFRASEPVWGEIGSELPEAFGYVTATGAGGAELEVRIVVGASAAFVADVADGFELRFASTTCACDVLRGVHPSVAEPGAAALLACAAAALCARRARPRVIASTPCTERCPERSG